MNRPDNNQAPRREIKIVLQNISEGQARHLIRSHYSAFQPIHYRRRINNVYFDTPDFLHYHENVNGLPRRIKPRIRWYGETFGRIQDPVLEIKAKDNLWGTKFRYNLDPSNDEPPYCWDPISFPKNQFQVNLGNHQPLLGNTYIREYFLSFDGHYRLTLDKDVAYFEVHRRFAPALQPWLKDSQGRLVLEIKCDKEHEAGLPGVVSGFPFRVSRNSKYVNGIRKIHGKA